MIGAGEAYPRLFGYRGTVATVAAVGRALTYVVVRALRALTNRRWCCTSMSDDGLESRAIRGDRNALTELLERVGPEVRGRIRGGVPARWQAILSEDDVMQQTYADAFMAIHQFTPLGDGAFRAWLTSLATNNLRDGLRMLQADKRGGKAMRVHLVAQGDSFVELFDVLSAGGTSPSRLVAKDEIRVAMKEAVHRLPQDYRSVVEMYDFEGRSASDVGESMSRSAGAVYMLRARAHDLLREAMGVASSFFSDSP